MRAVFLSACIFFVGIANSARAESLDAWLDFAVPRAGQKLLANISPKDTATGAVVASPSRRDPDYFFHWIRDAALVMETVLDMRAHGLNPGRARTMMWDYVNFSRANQQTHNWSGKPWDTGLGEPKFHVDGSPYNDHWARPQNDGPALRAITLARFAHELINEGRESEVRQALYDSRLPADGVIKADLEFVAHHWKDPSFDLWEEVRGKHFYTRMVQRKAMIEGAKLADRLGDAGAAAFYRAQATQISEQIAWHWDSGRGYLLATIDRDAGVDYKGSGLDVAVILGVLHGNTNDGFYGPCNDQVLATSDAIRDMFERIYSINGRDQDWLGEPMGASVGRYPEDRYDGYHVTGRGNGWFLATAGVGEMYYRCAQDWAKQKIIPITKRNIVVLKRILAQTGSFRSNFQVGEQLSSTDPRFFDVLNGLRRAGDSMLRRVRFHAAKDASMSEQMNRDSGYMQGATDLTWSYAALLTAAFARAQ